MAENAAVVQALYDAFRPGDIDGILGLVDSEVEWSASLALPRGGTYMGRAGVLAYFQAVTAAWRSFTVEVEAVGEISPGLVASVVQAYGSLRGHGDASFGAVHIFNIEDGLITRFREYGHLEVPLPT
jgi:ketosteroid isomerase-like protein